MVDARTRPGAHDRVVRWSDRLIDGSVVALAAWTVVFHLARWTGLPRDGALAVWLVGGVLWFIVRWWFPSAGFMEYMIESSHGPASNRFLILTSG